jgi:hypothetical protein
MTIALSTLAAEAGLMAFFAYELMTAPEGYEDSSGFHYCSPPVEFAGGSRRADVVDITRARRRPDSTARV